MKEGDRVRTRTTMKGYRFSGTIEVVDESEPKYQVVEPVTRVRQWFRSDELVKE